MRKPITKNKHFKHKIVMLIDDNDLDNIINQKVIEAANFAELVYTNTSAISALEFLKNLEVSNELSHQLLPEYIFVDINMPLIDGIQFIELFYKQLQNVSAKSKLIVLTSSINSNDKVKVKQINSSIPFLTKPLNAESLSLIG